LRLALISLRSAWISFRPIWKPEPSPARATAVPGPDRIAPLNRMGLTSFGEILPIAEQAVNDYALFAICLGRIAILDSPASFMS
jgi:hypothetical protein